MTLNNLKQVATNTIKVISNNVAYGVVTDNLRELKVEDYQKIRDVFVVAKDEINLKELAFKAEFDIIKLEKFHS